MHRGLWRGPLLLLLWQAAPVSVQRDSSGGMQVVLGFGGGQFEQRDLTCAGDVISAAPAPFAVGGAQLDAWPKSNVRLTAYGGILTSGEQSQGFGGVQAALEGRGAGIGLGAAATPWSAIDPNFNQLQPSLYVRLGSRNRGHFRLDLFGPTPTPGATGDVLRIGVGYNAGLRRGTRWFAGFGVGPFADESQVFGLFGDVEFPLSQRLDLGAGASYRPSQTYADASFRLGVRYHFPR